MEYEHDDYQVYDHPERTEGAPPWIVTFGDMMALLLTFFVLLLSFSEIDHVAFAQIMGSLKTAFGVQQVQILTNPQNGPLEKRVPQEGNASGEGVLEKLNSILPGAFAGGKSGLSSGTGSSRYTFAVPSKLLFDSGDSSLKPDFQPKLEAIGKLMKERSWLRLQVFGHTDSRPIRTAHFHDNWELSASRASSVIRFLIKREIDPKRLVAVGYADSRPVATNKTAQGRESNRRVEFLFIEDDDMEALDINEITTDGEAEVLKRK